MNSPAKKVQAGKGLKELFTQAHKRKHTTDVKLALLVVSGVSKVLVQVMM